MTRDQCGKVKARGQRATAKLRTKAPVNVGRNYNGPKVAKFLVGQVPTCTNGITMATLSPPETQ